MRRVRELVASGELGKVKSVQATLALPYWASRFLFLKDDVRFQYDLGGGATMDMGGTPRVLQSPASPPPSLMVSPPQSTL